MAVNYSRVTQGSAQRGWTAGSIAPRATDTRGPIANIRTSGNIPSNIMQAIGNLSAQQAFQSFLTGMPGSGGQQQQPGAPQVVFNVDQAAIQRAEVEKARQRAAQAAAGSAGWQLSGINQSLLNLPTQFGGILPMGMGAERAALQQQQFGLENQLAMANAAAFATPRVNGWVGGF